jgi:AAA family ATP:ADP antiporter
MTLTLMPLLSMCGFLAIGVAPIIGVLAVFQVLRRAAGFAVLRPAREILFTVLRREDKYKAKSFIDTFGYRAGDQVGAWSYKGLHDLGLSISTTSFIAVPLVAGWCGLSLWLGRKQLALAKAQPATTR